MRPGRPPLFVGNGSGFYVGAVALTSGLLRRGFMSGLEPRPRDGLTHGSDSPRKKGRGKRNRKRSLSMR